MSGLATEHQQTENIYPHRPERLSWQGWRVCRYRESCKSKYLIARAARKNYIYKTCRTVPEECISWVLLGSFLRVSGLQEKKPQIPVEAPNVALLQLKPR